MADLHSEEVPAEQITLSCSCGGTTTVNVAPGDAVAVANCACGKVLLWARPDAPPPGTISLNVTDHSTVAEKLK